MGGADHHGNDRVAGVDRPGSRTKAPHSGTFVQYPTATVMACHPVASADS